MDSITRRSFLGQTGAMAILAGVPASLWADEAAQEWAGGELKDPTFRLILSPSEGLRHTCLTHVASGLVLAKGDYSFSFERPVFEESWAQELLDGTFLVRLRASALDGHAEILLEFRVPRDHPWIEEQITLTNRGTATLDLHDARCGFVLPVAFSDGRAAGNWAHFRFTAVPFRREPLGHRTQYHDFSLTQVLTEQFSSELWTLETTITPTYASEGWIWTDGTLGFLITKYSQKGMEWSLPDRVPLQAGRIGLR